MARNRDAVTQRAKRALNRFTKELGRRPPSNLKVTREDKIIARTMGQDAPTSSARVSGRRGVRARRREARIAQRMMNGTYRQPSGGTITNSP